jgi:glycogen debranching enzyme
MSDEPLTHDDWLALRRMAEKVFAYNQVELPGGIFHMPSADLYVSMFAWDSGWHAIGMMHLDPALAASEIEVLLNQQCEDGHVPHEVLFDIEKRRSLKRIITMAAVHREFDESNRSAFIDPPSFMVAAEKIYELTRDRGWLERIIPRLERCADYLSNDRDLFGDGLVSIIHPWESGTDTSPVFDEPLNISYQNIISSASRALIYPAMLNRCAKLDWDVKRIAQENRFVFEDLTVNSIFIRGLVSLGRLEGELGNEEKARNYMGQARDMMAALIRINWDEHEGCFFPRFDLDNPRLSRRTTCASLLPMFTGLLDKKRADRIVKEHIKNPEEFWIPYLFPFNAHDELEKDGKIYFENLMLWRGHCIWTNMNWMINEALLEYGYEEEARELTMRTARMILNQGFREFYDTRTGRGQGTTRFCWPAVVLDMIKRACPEAVKE